MEGETSEKRQISRLNGAADGVPFTSENQPSSEAKKRGWKEKRAEKHLTQMIIKKIIDAPEGDKMGLPKYVDAIIDLAKNGNAKAIDTINNGLEDMATKIELSGTLKHEVITGMIVTD